ncbi:PTS fructose transporter subunit IIBC, partial [Pseudomonas aeruginosa]|nr:PTS fructose transporter subunit IIBC [Pseudomonas aeruginosa]
LSLAFGIDAYKQPGSLAAVLRTVGDTAFVLMVPMLAGYIAYSIADRPGLAPRVPASLEALKPILVIPLLASLVTGLLMLYVVGKPVAGMLAALTGFLDGMGTSNAILLGLLL